MLKRNAYIVRSLSDDFRLLSIFYNGVADVNKYMSGLLLSYVSVYCLHIDKCSLSLLVELRETRSIYLIEDTLPNIIRSIFFSLPF